MMCSFQGARGWGFGAFGALLGLCCSCLSEKDAPCPAAALAGAFVATPEFFPICTRSACTAEAHHARVARNQVSALVLVNTIPLRATQKTRRSFVAFVSGLAFGDTTLSEVPPIVQQEVFEHLSLYQVVPDFLSAAIVKSHFLHFISNYSAILELSECVWLI